MNERIKIGLLWLLAIPAFTGFPVNRVPGFIVPGAAYGWIGYGLLVHLAVRATLGKKPYRVAVAVTGLITAPVVLLGALISLSGLVIRGWDPVLGIQYSAHYTSLAISMLTVIPLALTLVAVIPFHRLENRLLRKDGGVSLAGKSALMFLRVFSHIFYFVIPNILEVVREERTFGAITGRRQTPGAGPLTLRRRLAALARLLTQVGLEGICAAVRYIPLWADEISRLPAKDRPAKKKKE